MVLIKPEPLAWLRILADVASAPSLLGFGFSSVSSVRAEAHGVRQHEENLLSSACDWFVVEVIVPFAELGTSIAFGRSFSGVTQGHPLNSVSNSSLMMEYAIVGLGSAHSLDQA